MPRRDRQPLEKPAARPAHPGSSRPVTIDLNCDLAEGSQYDSELLALVSSANIACGVHAGSPALMQSTAAEAARRGVAIGAHPGLADRTGRGRSAQPISIGDAFDLVLEQVQALQAIAPGAVRHVKPHGALYNQAARKEPLAQAIAAAVYAADPALRLMGLAGGELLKAGAAIGLATVAEGFADRGGRADGTLIPRDQPGALITDPAAAAAQAVKLAQDGLGGVQIQTICIHGDTPGAVAIARAVRAALEAAGFRIAAVAAAPGGEL